MVESQPSKLLVAGSIPVSRSRLLSDDCRLTIDFADVAQLAERVLGKDEVTGPIPVIGSRRRLFNARDETAWRKKNLIARNHT